MLIYGQDNDNRMIMYLMFEKGVMMDRGVSFYSLFEV